MAQPGPPSQVWQGAPYASNPTSVIAPPPPPSTAPLSTPLTTAFPSTSHLSRSDLQKLLGTAYHPSQSDDAFFNFVESLEGTKALREEIKRLRDECEAVAASNLSLKPALESLRAETQEAFDRAKALEAEWPRVEAQQREAYKTLILYMRLIKHLCPPALQLVFTTHQRFAPASLHATLSQSLSKLHDDSESLASAYVEGLPLDDPTDVNGNGNGNGNGIGIGGGTGMGNGNGGIDDEQAFARRYRALRNKYHRRNIVAERWAAGGVTWRDE